MARTPELQRFYGSKRWRDLRDMLVIQRHGICERCGRNYSDDTSMLTAHHKEHLTDDTLKDPQVAVNPENIEILCARCHALQHRTRGFIKKRKEVFLVYGPPLSGKTTYVKDQMDPGDLVVDLDTIRSAISYMPIYEQPPALDKTVFAVRDFLYDQIRIRSGGWQTAWVIAGMPRKDDRDRLAARLGASVILIEATEDECRRRLISADDGRDITAWEGYITRWFREYIP